MGEKMGKIKKGNLIKPLANEKLSSDETIKEVNILKTKYEELLKDNLELSEKIKRIENTLNEKQLIIDTLNERVRILSQERFNQQIHLEYFENDKDKSFDVGLRVCSGKVRSEFLVFDMKAIELQENLTAKIEKKKEEIIKDLKGKTESEAQFVISKEITKITTDLRIAINLLSIEQIKSIIDDRQLPTEQKALVRSEPNSDFWQNVDEEEVQKTLISFRSAHKI